MRVSKQKEEQMSNKLKCNAEGYQDSTAYKAIMAMSAEEKKKMKVQMDHDKLIQHLKYVIELSGFRLSERIKLVHRGSGRKFE